jgi:hypothetical protein
MAAKEVTLPLKVIRYHGEALAYMGSQWLLKRSMVAMES